MKRTLTILILLSICFCLLILFSCNREELVEEENSKELATSEEDETTESQTRIGINPSSNMNDFLNKVFCLKTVAPDNTPNTLTATGINKPLELTPYSAAEQRQWFYIKPNINLDSFSHLIYSFSEDAPLAMNFPNNNLTLIEKNKAIGTHGRYLWDFYSMAPESGLYVILNHCNGIKNYAITVKDGKVIMSWCGQMMIVKP